MGTVLAVAQVVWNVILGLLVIGAAANLNRMRGALEHMAKHTPKVRYENLH